MNGGRAVALPVAVVAIAAGVIATFAPPAPTGNTTIDAVFVGQVLPAGAGQNPARQAAVGAGIP